MLPIIVVLLLQLADGAASIPARLLSAAAPKPPLNAIAATCVLADVPVNVLGSVGDPTILQGIGPFNDSAKAAIKQWKFSPAKANADGKPKASRVGVLAVFRPASIGTEGLGGPSLGYERPSPPRSNHPPLPISISDPGYPLSVTTMGVVIIELTIDKQGVPSSFQTIQDIPTLTQISREAIQSWKFMPAMESGQPVDGTLIVAISFLRPV
jgi:outer membrane biosynthesis protein TonB